MAHLTRALGAASAARDAALSERAQQQGALASLQVRDRTSRDRTSRAMRTSRAPRSISRHLARSPAHLARSRRRRRSRLSRASSRRWMRSAIISPPPPPERRAEPRLEARPGATVHAAEATTAAAEATTAAAVAAAAVPAAAAAVPRRTDGWTAGDTLRQAPEATKARRAWTDGYDCACPVDGRNRERRGRGRKCAHVCVVLNTVGRAGRGAVGCHVSCPCYVFCAQFGGSCEAMGPQRT